MKGAREIASFCRSRYSRLIRKLSLPSWVNGQSFYNIEFISFNVILTNVLQLPAGRNLNHWTFYEELHFKFTLMRYFWDAAVALNPAVQELDEGHRFPLCQPVPLTELFTQAGLRDVEVQPIDIAIDFRNFNEYWTPFLGGQGPAPGYPISLNEEHRATLGERLQAALPIAEDRSPHCPCMGRSGVQKLVAAQRDFWLY